MPLLHRFDTTKGQGPSSKRVFEASGFPGMSTARIVLSLEHGLLPKWKARSASSWARSSGYDFNFIREAQLAGLTGDIGTEDRCEVKAEFGFEVSGRYLVAIGRESTNPPTSAFDCSCSSFLNGACPLGLTSPLA